MTKRQRILTGILAGIVLGTGLSGNAVVSASVTDGKVLVENMNRSPDYYILPESQTRELADWEVKNIDTAGRQMAINEIYARHGRKFVLPEVQTYFEEKNWYKGTVEASDFDENVFNEYEEKNIATLQKSFESGYFLDGSDSRYLTDEEIKNLTNDELQLGINEIYARHGRKFSSEKYRNYFSEKTWYNGTIEPDHFDEKVLNGYEQENIRKLTEAMK